MMPKNTVIESVAQYIDWANAIDENKQRHTLYRGERKNRGIEGLQPTLLRPGEYYDWEKHHQIVDSRDPIETVADPAGLSSEYELPAYRVERHLMQEFKRCAGQFIDVEPKDELEWMALARHHQLGTRLLDWTTNPLAALWFAVKEPAEEAKAKAKAGQPKKRKAPPAKFKTQEEIKKFEGSVVYAFCYRRGDWLDREKEILGDRAADYTYNPPEPKILTSRLFFPRVRAQSGVFTLHPFDARRNLSKKPAEQFNLALIPWKSRWDIRRELNRSGINDAMLLADLDSYCHTINWNRTWDKDGRLEKNPKCPQDHIRQRAAEVGLIDHAKDAVP